MQWLGQLLSAEAPIDAGDAIRYAERNTDSPVESEVDDEKEKVGTYSTLVTKTSNPD